MTQKHQLKGYSTYWKKNNSLQHCTTDKNWYIHAVILYINPDLNHRYKN